MKRTMKPVLTAAALAALLSACGPPPANGVAIIKIYGPIQVEPEQTMLGIEQGGSDAVVRKIRGYGKNERVKAIVLRVNSPGGTPAACQEILEEIKRVKKDGKKVVVSMADMAVDRYSSAKDSVFSGSSFARTLRSDSSDFLIFATGTFRALNRDAAQQTCSVNRSGFPAETAAASSSTRPASHSFHNASGSDPRPDPASG